MERHGQHKSWRTSVSEYKRAHFVRLVDQDNLTIIINVEDSPKCFCFKWHDFMGYKNTLEEHGIPWKYSEFDLRDGGCTHMVDPSPWLSDLRSGNDLLDILAPNAKHFVILTSLYVTEVISNQEPEIFEIEDPNDSFAVS